MNLKLNIFYLLIAVTALAFSACTSVESKNSEEVVIESTSGGPTDEVYITSADVKPEAHSVSTTQAVTQVDKRLLADKSEIETLLDGYGNKTETRYFKGHPRLRYVILRTSTEGLKEVTVYGVGGESKTVAGLDDTALTASGDEIAGAAQLSVQTVYGGKNFMKSKRTDNSQTPLQPLPSSAFQKPVSPVYQPSENISPETSGETVNTPARPEED